jgi:hypothetical protein
VAAEHLLAGALVAVGAAAGVPDQHTLEKALMVAQGAGDSPLANQVMFGSAARDAINSTAATVRNAGGRTIDARTVALGTIDSGEVSPMFYEAIGVDRSALRAALAAIQPT